MELTKRKNENKSDTAFQLWYCYHLSIDLTKNLEMEKKKFEKIKETLTKTEEELKGLRKVYFCCFSFVDESS